MWGRNEEGRKVHFEHPSCSTSGGFSQLSSGTLFQGDLNAAVAHLSSPWLGVESEGSA